ncbi:intron Large complex component GCFC2 isoform X3 [Aquila chrysaetos chrysaetos]|uniref:intron Large complex component GCFC2 isoform X3 n=1 Tax=Aquila chrysaetos chrysaetos TaxID=223781 RepID=UPI001176E56A|nr:intron Large complex component GCFC2 isoform X3 [Aquila chrysaetos chrysaetos]
MRAGEAVCAGAARPFRPAECPGVPRATSAAGGAPPPAAAATRSRSRSRSLPPPPPAPLRRQPPAPAPSGKRSLRRARGGIPAAPPRPLRGPGRPPPPPPRRGRGPQRSRWAAPGTGRRAEGQPPAEGRASPERGRRGGGKVLLSFGSEEEREGDEEFFKIKKPSFNEVTFRIQKKESLLPAQAETEESKKICQLVPRTVNTKGTREEEEEKEDESYSSLSEDYNSSDAENESSSPQRRKDLSPGSIPSAACIEAARRKRHLARSRADYLPLDVSNSHQVSQRRESSDLESEDESDMKNLNFVPKMRTVRERMTEHMVSDESSEEEAQIKWEEQQIKKAVKLSQETYDDASLHKSQPAKPKFDPSVSLPSVNLEIVKKRLTERITSLQDVHRAHQREYEKYIEDIESSKMTVQELEKSSDAALNYKFYRAMKTYAENLINCLNEKLKYINELELAVHVLLQKRAMMVLKRRQDELKNESAYIQHLTSGNDKPANGGLEDDDKAQLLEMCEHRRTCRRQMRECSGEADHHEGMSSDDELTPSEVTEFQKSKGKEWKEKFPDSYCDAYISFCLPKLLNPLIRVQLINWTPLEQNFTELEEMPWFRAIEEFSDAKNVSESKRDDDTDQEVLPRVIEKTILPKITAFVKSVWDPLSTSQTKNLVQLCNNIFEKQVLSKRECTQAKKDLMNMVVLRMKKSVEEDVFIPLYPKSAVEDKSSLCSKFQERRFWSAVKLLSNVLLWDGIVQEDTVRDLGLSKLLNRYLLLNLLNTPLGPDNIEKCTKVVACLPERWFHDLKSGSTLPELLNFCQHLLQCAHMLHKNNHSDETKEFLLLLVKVKALRIVEEFIEEYKLEHLKSMIGK